MSFRADYCCLSKKCETDGQAAVYELPTGSVRCPRCGSKRLRQLFNNPNVIARGAAPDRDFRLTSNSHLQRSTRLLQPEADHADSVKPPDDMRRGTFAMPGHEAGAVAPSGKGKPMTEMEQRRGARERPGGIESVLLSTRRAGVPTIPLVAKG